MIVYLYLVQISSIRRCYASNCIIFFRVFLSFLIFSTSNIFASRSRMASCAFAIRSCPILDNHSLLDTIQDVDLVLIIYHFFSRRVRTFDIIMGSNQSSFASLFWEREVNNSFAWAQDRYCITIYWAWVILNFLSTLFIDFCRFWVESRRWYHRSLVGLDMGDRIRR
jgi:hypothetical protein